ncbi:MAG: DinB family protein [Gemmatimonadaceae bacterium]
MHHVQLTAENAMIYAGPQRPPESEYASFYHRYVQAVPEGDVIHYLAAQLVDVEGLLGHLPDEQANARYAPDKWSVKEVLGHLSDTERVMSYRLLRAARGDATPLASFDQDDYVRAAQSGGRAIGDLLNEFRTVRASTLSLVKGVDGAAWDRTCVASNAVVSSRALVYIIAGHTAHHTTVLRERYGIAGVGTPAPPL